jgi:hypothetical protein
MVSRVALILPAIIILLPIVIVLEGVSNRQYAKPESERTRTDVQQAVQSTDVKMRLAPVDVLMPCCAASSRVRI